MQNIQELYKDYAFISSSEAQNRRCVVEDEGEEFHLIRRSYEEPFKWYFVVFSPYDDPYNRNPDWFKVKGMDTCRLLFKKPQVNIMTREILDCQKIHVNALVCTDQLLQDGQNYRNKYRLFVKQLYTQHDRESVLAYIGKEKTLRKPYLKYLDWYTYGRKK